MGERVLLGADHAGFALKEFLKAELGRRGFDVLDVGPDSDHAVDYPDYAKKVAGPISAGDVARGVLMCGTGLGMAYTANRFPQVRAAVAWTTEIAALSRQHNDANVLVLPARFVSQDEALAILDRWLETPFEGGQHDRRVRKIETADLPLAEPHRD